jgi:sugar lactone lactonase YvrE
VWFASERLDGTEFGTTGIVYRPGRRDLLVTQQSTALDGSAPTNGKLYRLPIRTNGRPGPLETLWTSLPGELPDGFGVARSGRIYVANAGLTAQLVVLSASGVELERFPELPVTGDNGSAIPFDTPSNATFLGTRLLVANQSFAGDRSHHAILDFEVGERGRTPYLPRNAYWR